MTQPWHWNYNMDEAPRNGERVLVSFVGSGGPRIAVAHWENGVWTGGKIIENGIQVPFTLRTRPPYAWSTAPEVAPVPAGWPS